MAPRVHAGLRRVQVTSDSQPPSKQKCQSKVTGETPRWRPRRLTWEVIRGQVLEPLGKRWLALQGHLPTNALCSGGKAPGGPMTLSSCTIRLAVPSALNTGLNLSQGILCCHLINTQSQISPRLSVLSPSPRRPTQGAGGLVSHLGRRPPYRWPRPTLGAKWNLQNKPLPQLIS